jgi:hypothetical protein
MPVQENTVFKTIAHKLQIPVDELLRLSLQRYLEYQLRLINIQIFEICGRYDIYNVEEMDSRYQDGTLDEEDSWRDLQRLDHLEYQRDELLKLCESLL